ncbi:MAG: hypothetical protein AAB409_07985 [Gemmatimonadota bacterium]
MGLRFIAAFAAVLLYLAAWAGALLPAALAARGNDTAILALTGATLLLAGGGLLPFLDFVAKRAFRFRGEGPPLPEADLRALITGIDTLPAPVMVTARKRRLVATWRYVDATWWQALSRSGLRKVHELQIKFDDARKRVTLIDVEKSVRWGTGPTAVWVWGGFFRGIALDYEIGIEWGIKKDLEFGKTGEYRFSAGEIRRPIMNSILRSGWDVQLGLW